MAWCGNCQHFDVSTPRPSQHYPYYPTPISDRRSALLLKQRSIPGPCTSTRNLNKLERPGHAAMLSIWDTGFPRRRDFSRKLIDVNHGFQCFIAEIAEILNFAVFPYFRHFFMTFRSTCSYFGEQWSFKNQITILLMKKLRACVDCILIQYMEKCFKFQMVNCFQLFKRFLVILNEFKLHLAMFVITYLIGRSAGRFSHYSSDGKVYL